MKNLIYIGIVLTAILAGCTGKKEEVKEAVVHHGHHDHPETGKKQYTCPMHPNIVEDHPGDCPVCGMELIEVQHHEGNVLKFSTAQMELGNITTMTVGSGDSGQGRVINGRVAVDEQQSQVVSARSAGRIDKLMFKQTGVRISKGQAVYELYSEELLTLEKEYLLAVDQYQALGKDNDRFASFLKAAENKLLLYGLNASQIAALKRSHKVNAEITIYAPFSGVITEIKVNEGQYVAEGSPVFTLQNLDQLWAEGEIYPEEAARIKVGQSVSVLTAGQQGAVTAKISFIKPEYEPGTQFTIIRANIQNAGSALQPGMQVQMVLPSVGKVGLTVPLRGIVRDAKGSMVFVKTGKNTFEPRMVKTGNENARMIEITEGLMAGEVIAGTGAYLIYSDMMLKQGGMAMGGMKM